MLLEMLKEEIGLADSLEVIILAESLALTPLEIAYRAKFSTLMLLEQLKEEIGSGDWLDIVIHLRAKSLTPFGMLKPLLWSLRQVKEQEASRHIRCNKKKRLRTGTGILKRPGPLIKNLMVVPPTFAESVSKFWPTYI